MMDGENIAAYIVFTRCGRTVIKGTTRRDIFTVFVTTHPDYRKRGLATKVVYEMLHGIDLEYEKSYKTVSDGNIGSQKAAFANGYEELYRSSKTRLLKTITKTNNTGLKLYVFNSK